MHKIHTNKSYFYQPPPPLQCIQMLPIHVSSEKYISIPWSAKNNGMQKWVTVRARSAASFCMFLNRYQKIRTPPPILFTNRQTSFGEFLRELLSDLCWKFILFPAFQK